MKIVRINKLYKGFASLASTDVSRWIKEGETLLLKYGRAKMTLTPKDLEFRGLRLNDKTYYSKKSGIAYKLIDYKFVDESNEEFRTKEIFSY